MRLVIFDFCETLVNFQTADQFVFYVIKRQGLKYNLITELYIKYNFFNKLINKINSYIPKFNLSKRLIATNLKGIDADILNNYAEEFLISEIEPNLNTIIFGTMQKHVNDNDYVIIVSGGYTNYLESFARKNKLFTSFGTNLKIKKGKLTGFFNGKDCMGNEKVNIIEKFVESNSLKFTETVVYTDSISDLPILRWANFGIVISKGESQIWAKKFKFKEVII